MSSQDLGAVDRLLAEVAAGRLSRRDVMKRAAALGVSGATLAALAAAAPLTAGAQGTMQLSFDGGATGGGSGQPNAPATAYCYIIDGGSMYELNRMVDSRLV